MSASNNDLFSKFNDFSRYKNNELKRYFTRKELEYSNSLREKSKIKTDTYIVSAFAFIFSTILKFNSLGDKPELEPKGLLDKAWYFFKNIDINSIIAALIIGGAYYIMFGFIVPFLVFLVSFIKKKIMTSKSINNLFNNIRSFSEKEIKKISDPEHIDKFNNEVVNQLSLALSVLSHIENDNNNEAEKLFYLDECAEYLKKSLNSHFGILLYPDAVKKIKAGDSFFIDIERIKTMLKISSDIIKRIQVQNQSVSSVKINTDVSLCNERIRSIETQLAGAL